MKEKFKILCVDDEEDILRSLKRALLLEGYIVFTALSGEDGLEVLEKNKIDLVISDQRMPNMKGYEFLRLVREKHPNVIRIMLSGYSDFESLVRTINEGEIFRFLSKPWNLQELRDMVKICLEQNFLIAQVTNSLHNFRKMGGFKDDFTVEQTQENNSVCFKVKVNQEVHSLTEVVNFFDTLLDSLGVNKENGLPSLMNAISKSKERVIFAIDLGKGVVLNVELPLTEGLKSSKE